MVSIFTWPKAIHEGEGRAFLIIDENATEEQRGALLSILSGEHTEGKTIWNVFAATLVEVLPPEFKQIDLEIDADGCIGKVHVDGLVEARGEPIRNSITGAEHRARIDLPDGFEHAVAEIASGSCETHGPIALDLNKTHGQFAYLHLNNQGVVRA